jgi:hypothetical protein
MTLSKRKSRKIVVGDEAYRWSASQDSGYMVLVVQKSSGQGKRLEVIISDDKNIVIEKGSYSVEVGGGSKLVITPRLVEKVITDALSVGWDPNERGAPVALSLVDGSLQIRRGL